MTQFLRPDGDVTKTNWSSGGYADIDESTASNSDYAYSSTLTAVSNTATLEVSLTNSSGTPDSGTSTCRFRVAKVSGVGALSGSGEAVFCDVSIYEGATLIDTYGSSITLTGAFVQYSFTPDLSTVSDWTNLRIRFLMTTDLSGLARGGAVSWAELEVPNEAGGGGGGGSGGNMMLMFN
jgi:hypothetical protein